MLGFAGQIQGFFLVDFDLVRDDVFRLLDVFGSQELLGARAARSAFSVVVPFDVDGHGDPLRLCVSSMALCLFWVLLASTKFPLAGTPTKW